LVTDKSCYIYVLESKTENRVKILFPESNDQDNFVNANSKKMLPPRKGAGYPIVEPTGEHRILVMGLPKQIDIESGDINEVVQTLIRSGILANRSYMVTE
jgi:hypothetical protein